MSDYLNLTGPHLSAAGLNPLGAGGLPASPAPVSMAAPSPHPAPLLAHGPIAADTRLQGTVSGLLGNDLDRISAGGVPISRDVLNLSTPGQPAVARAPQPSSDVLSDFRAHASPISLQALGLSEGGPQLALTPPPATVATASPDVLNLSTPGQPAVARVPQPPSDVLSDFQAHASPISLQALGLSEGGPQLAVTPPPATVATASPDVLARWETPVDIDAAALGRVDLSSHPVAATPSPLESRAITGDRQAYQQRYGAAGDVLDLGRVSPDVAAALDGTQPVALATPTAQPVSETKRLDRLISLMARGVDVGQVENPLVAAPRSVVSAREVNALSEAPYGTAGSMGLTLGLSRLDPSSLLSEHMRGGTA